MSYVQLRIIGDVHAVRKYPQRAAEYVRIASRSQYSIQLGDLGYYYDFMTSLDPSRHFVIPGNHENYEQDSFGRFVHFTPHFKKDDFGVFTIPGLEPYFYVRGERSIDMDFRKEGETWWPAEELTYESGQRAVELYKAIKPRYVITHGCPKSVIRHVSALTETVQGMPVAPSLTANLLDELFSIHQPRMWYFGHYHTSKYFTERGTKFVALGKLHYSEIFRKVY